MLQRAAAILLLATGVVSCATKTDTFSAIEPPPTGWAAIYVYRSDLVAPAYDLSEPVVLVDGRTFPALRPGTYFRTIVRPGDVTVTLPRYQDRRSDLGIWTATTDAEVRLVANEGNVYFVALDIQPFKYRFGQKDVLNAVKVLPNLRKLN